METIFVEIGENGKCPSRAHSSDAGADLFASRDFTVGPGQILKHPLDIRLQLPSCSYVEVTSKSGNGSRGLLVYAGIIDEAYRGIVHVVMTNMLQPSLWTRAKYFFRKEKPWVLKFKKGQKIAQAIFHPFKPVKYQQVNSISTDTSRSTGGFGSTGNSLI